MGKCLSWIAFIFLVCCGTLAFIGWAITKGGWLTAIALILIASAIVGICVMVKGG